MLKVGYFADGKWGHNAFEKLISDNEIECAFICVRSDSEDTQFQIYSEKYKIPLLKHKNINSLDFIKIIKNFECDLLISMSFNQIFREKIINLTRYGIINCHAGKLPNYRGRNILNWALINDEKEFGITVHYVDTGIDTGDIILQKTYPIVDSDNYKTILELAHVECAKVLYEAISLFKKGMVKGRPQAELGVTGFYCGKRIEGDEVIDWNQTSRELFNFIRSICIPGPRASTILNGKLVKINRAKFIPNLRSYKGIPGQVLEKTKEGYLVKTLDSFIEILEIESEAKIVVGDRLK